MTTLIGNPHNTTRYTTTNTSFVCDSKNMFAVWCSCCDSLEPPHLRRVDGVHRHCAFDVQPTIRPIHLYSVCAFAIIEPAPVTLMLHLH